MNSADRELRTQTTCLFFLSGIAGAGALYWLRPVLMPFVLALFFTIGVAPILAIIEKRIRAPRIVAVAIAFFLGIAVVALLWVLVWASVASLLRNADVYKKRLAELTARVTPAQSAPPHTENDAVSGDVPNHNHERSASETLSTFVEENVGRWLSEFSNALIEICSNAVMVLIFVFFLLLGGAAEAVPRSGVWSRIETSIRDYIVAKTVISIVTAAVFGFVLWIFGVPLALVFGLLAFLLNFIPNIGPILANLLPLPLIVLHPDLSPLGMVVLIAAISAIQFISGNIVEPKIMGKSFELHPVAILLALMFWGMIWGIVGMFLATPITAAVKILLGEFDHTRPLAQMLEGKFDWLPGTSDKAKETNT